jgi:hypothetical protein
MDIANGGDAMGQYLVFAKGNLKQKATEKLWKDLSAQLLKFTVERSFFF